MLISRFTALLVAVSSAAPTFAQSQLYEISGLVAGARFGEVIALVPDVDGDGRDDLLIGAPMESSAGPESGAVYLFSAASGAQLLSLCGFAPGDHFGTAVAGLADIDGDGKGDFAVGSPDSDVFGPQSGSVYIFSGADGSLIHQINGAWPNMRMGRHLGQLPDLNGNGSSELGVVADGDNSFGSGSMHIYDSLTGTLLDMLTAGVIAGSGAGLLRSPPRAWPDITGDGVGEILVPWCGLNRGVTLLSGADRSVILQIDSGDSCGFGPVAAAPAGDRDGDGVLDLYLASGTSPRIRSYSGVNGIQLEDVQVLPNLSTAHFLDAMGDSDGDGFNDVIASDPNLNFGLGIVNVLTPSGSVLKTFVGSQQGDNLGAGAMYIGDLDGDGATEFIFGVPGFDPGGLQDAGTVRVYGGCMAPTPVSYCGTTPNSAGPGAFMGWSGSTSVTLNGFSVTCSGAITGQFGLFFYGSDSVSVPFGNGVRCVGGFNGIFRLDPVPVGAGGNILKHVDFSASPASGGPGQIVGGSIWNFQFWYRDPMAGGAGFDLSDGLRVTFCF